MKIEKCGIMSANACTAVGAIGPDDLREARRAFQPLRQDVLYDCLSRSGFIICAFWYHSSVSGRQMVDHFDSCFVLD